MSEPRYRDVGTVEVRLTEELAEVIQVVQKAQRWGWHGVNPDDGKDKRTRVVEEIHDVAEAWNELAIRVGLPTIRLICGACGGSGYYVRSAHDARCDGSCELGCPVPVREQCDGCEATGVAVRP